MAKYWTKPYYPFKNSAGKDILIDVTTSASAGLEANSVIVDTLVPLLKARKAERILDFGAGALRHTLALLDNGFEVCAVEFEEAFKRPTASRKLQEAEKYANFSALVWPKQFIADKRKFDAALLVYVLQVMPVPEERMTVLSHLYKKLNKDTYLFYSSRFGQITSSDKKHKVSDGFYRWPKRKSHSFYREFTTEQTDKLITAHGFSKLRNLSEGGSQQLLLYGKGSATWA